MKIFLTVVITLVAALAIAGGLGWWILAKKARSEADPIEVRIEKPTRGTLVEVVSAPGSVKPRTRVSISARISARIVELPYEEGDHVTKGDPGADPPIPPSVLVRLDATDLEAALSSAEALRDARAAEIKVAQARMAGQEADIQGIQASLREARLNLDRKKKLRETGDVPQSDYDQANCRVEELTAQQKSAEESLRSQRLNLEVIRHQLAAADAEIAQAKDKLSYTTITSPINGVVTAVNAEVGELVITGTMNNPGTVVMELADLSKMLVVAEVDESDVGHLAVGQPASIEIRAYPDRKFEGTVESIALAGRQMSLEARVFLVEILLDTGGRRIYSGLTAEVEIRTRRHENVLKLPSQAVLGRRVDELPSEIREGNPNIDPKKTFATVVYRSRDGKSVVTPVALGPSDATHTVIVSGLSEDDRVVTGPFKVLEKLAHDQPLAHERESAATQPAQTQPSQTQPARAAEARPKAAEGASTAPAA